MSDWKERAEQWRRFAAWESDQLRRRPSDFAAALAWMAQAWQLARAHDPGWSDPRVDDEHIGMLRAMRSALERIRPR